MNGNQNIPEVDAGIPNGAMSVYGGQDGLDDFPVLKAFQQYVDAEQAKARKRMVQLSIFFAVLMCCVIAVFVALVINVTNKNQALNDRLVEYAMRDRQTVQTPVQPVRNSESEAALKAMAESMSNMQKQLVEQQSRLAEQQLKLAEQAMKNAAAATAAAAVQPQPARIQQQTPAPESAKSTADAAQEAKIKAARDKLAAEREALAKERESLRQQEKDLQLRRLYPELYDADGKLLPPRQPKKEAAAPVRYAPPANAPHSVDVDDDDDFAEIDAAIEKEAQRAARPDAMETGDGAITYFDDGDAITYFDDKDDTPPPAKAKAGKKKAAGQTPKAQKKQPTDSSGWRIPLE